MNKIVLLLLSLTPVAILGNGNPSFYNYIEHISVFSGSSEIPNIQSGTISISSGTFLDSIPHSKNFSGEISFSSATLNYLELTPEFALNIKKDSNYIPDGVLDYLLMKEASLFLSNPMNLNYFENYSNFNNENDRLTIAHNWAYDPEIDSKYQNSNHEISLPYKFKSALSLGLELNFEDNSFSTLFNSNELASNVGLKLGLINKLCAWMTYETSSREDIFKNQYQYEKELIEKFVAEYDSVFKSSIEEAKFNNIDPLQVKQNLEKELTEKYLEKYYQTYGDAFKSGDNYNSLNQFFLGVNLFIPITDQDFIHTDKSNFTLQNLDTNDVYRVEALLSLNYIHSRSNKNRFLTTFEFGYVQANNIVFEADQLSERTINKSETQVIEGESFTETKELKAFVGEYKQYDLIKTSIQGIWIPSFLSFSNGSTVGIRLKTEYYGNEAHVSRFIMGIPFSLYSQKKEQINFEIQWQSNFIEDIGKHQPITDSRIGIALAIPFGGFKK